MFVVVLSLLQTWQEVVKLEFTAPSLSLCMSSAIKVVLNRVLIMSGIKRQSSLFIAAAELFCLHKTIMYGAKRPS